MNRQSQRWIIAAAALLAIGCCELLPEFCCESQGVVPAVYVEFRDQRGCAFQDEIPWKVSFVDGGNNNHLEEGDLQYHDTTLLGPFEMRDSDEDCKADSVTILIDDGCHPGTHYNLTLENEVFSLDIITVTIEADGHPSVVLNHSDPAAIAKLNEVSGCNCLPRITKEKPIAGTKMAGSLRAATAEVPPVPIPDPDAQRRDKRR